MAFWAQIRRRWNHRQSRPAIRYLAEYDLERIEGIGHANEDWSPPGACAPVLEWLRAVANEPPG